MPTFRELGLPNQLVDALASRDVTTPFPIQALTVPDALAGRDLLARGETGSGKTLAFGLPLLTRLAASQRPRGAASKAPRAIVLVPTRELARQVDGVLFPLARALRLRMRSVFGGVPIGRQINALRQGVDVLVATPGRLTDLIKRGVCSLDEVEITVLDEADHLCDLGFFPAVCWLLDRTPAGGQRMLFSATLDRDVDRLVRQYLVDPVSHEIDPVPDARAAEHKFVNVTPHDKLATTADLWRSAGRTIVFVQTKHGADRLTRQLSQLGVPAVALHGNLSQSARLRALSNFGEGGADVLVATDVAARGIHVDNVRLVVHFDPPSEHKSYLHRSGRTARAGASGQIVTLVLPEQRRSVARLIKLAGVDAALEPAPFGTAPDDRPARPARPGRHPRYAGSRGAAASGRRPRYRPTRAGA
ncbi:MAG: DEAD/DEAH box helicase [Mycobacteriales bacterium]